MNEQEIKFLKRLKTIKNKACDERTVVKTIYNRAEKGIYKMVEVDGVKFILEDEEVEYGK